MHERDLWSEVVEGPSTGSGRIDRLTAHCLEQLDPMQCRIVVREGPDWPRWCLPRLEAHSDPTQSRPPDPATAVLIMLDIRSGGPALARRLFFRERLFLRHILGLLGSRRLRHEEIFLQGIGETSHSDAEEPHPSGGFNCRQQRSGDRTDHIGPISRADQRA